MNRTFSKDGGKYNLPSVWDNIVKKRVKSGRSWSGRGACFCTGVFYLPVQPAITSDAQCQQLRKHVVTGS